MNEYQLHDSLFQPDNFPTLTTDRLLLKKLDMSDRENMFSLKSDRETARAMGELPYENTEKAEELIINCQYAYEFKMGINWSIYLKYEFFFIGYIGIWKIDREHFRGEIGYGLLPNARRKGYMEEALKAVIETAFKGLHLHSLEANIDPDNNNSVKLLEKLGFKQEGLLKENYYLDGKFYNTALFSLVR
ncbi:MAG: GNAT family N-acetyltransferase [Victivallales bacterium]|nr:GNAT family N-acetyltransferase [Victivallales bacterium]